MAKIDKKKATHKAKAVGKSFKSNKGPARPTVINKGPKKKLEMKKKEFKPASKFDKSQKPARKPLPEVKQKSFAANGRKFEVKKTGAPVSGVKKKEIRIEQTSKQEYLRKQEMKKKEQEKSLNQRRDGGKPVAAPAKPAVAARADASPKITAKSAQEPAPKAKKVDAKSASSAAGRKAKKPKEENELDDVFIDDVGTNEIEEYEDDLKAVEELDNETDDDLLLETEVKERKYEDVELTDADGNKLCRSRDCDQISTVDGYCRFHYLLFWKNIQVRKRILTDGKLDRYIEELTTRYPDKFLEMIRRDMRNQKDFLAAIQELEIDESNVDNDFEEESQNFIDEVRGVNEGSSIEEEFE